jgi:hypothetical protein
MKRHAAGGNITADEIDALWSLPQRLKAEQIQRQQDMQRLLSCWTIRAAELEARAQRQRSVKPASPFDALLKGSQ